MRKYRKKIKSSYIRRNKKKQKSKPHIDNNAYVAIHDENEDGYIVLKEESLYKPLLIIFGIQLFVMIVLFPNIFDDLWKNEMSFLRNLISWVSLSATATLLPLPVSFADVRLLTQIVIDPVKYSNIYLILISLFIVISDTFFAYLGYKFAKTLRKLFMSKKTDNADEKKANERLLRYGNIAMFLGAASPLPFTLMIYVAGAIKLPKRGFVIAVFIGRLVKYSLLTLPLRLFNFNFIEWGKTLWNDFTVGNLYSTHYIFIIILMMLVLFFTISLLRTIKKGNLEKKQG